MKEYADSSSSMFYSVYAEANQAMNHFQKMGDYFNDFMSKENSNKKFDEKNNNNPSFGTGNNKPDPDVYDV